MTRLRLTITLVQEYDAEPTDYVEAGATITPEEMAEIDRANADEDPTAWIHGDCDFNAKCEVIKP
jgi:hypothetical protein